MAKKKVCDACNCVLNSSNKDTRCQAHKDNPRLIFLYRESDCSHIFFDEADALGMNRNAERFRITPIEVSARDFLMLKRIEKSLRRMDDREQSIVAPQFRSFLAEAYLKKIEK